MLGNFVKQSLEKLAAAAAARARGMVQSYEVLELAAEKLLHSCHEHKPDARESVLLQIPSSTLFAPAGRQVGGTAGSSANSTTTHNKLDPVDFMWAQIAHGMLHASRLRQEQQREEQLLYPNCIGMQRLMQDFRRGKEAIEEAMAKKHLSTPPTRPSGWGFHRGRLEPP
eukprot:TRINITY_DN12505_c0_g1_i2.p2 TRINITY_DN12505_c0_g1~~TRINITY_DN12505_c0_g1_i2.p2  ORF type:complete len:169 (+),score=64.94 TRINITY_DN12505_c0_g1_i2:270-776(+)